MSASARQAFDSYRRRHGEIITPEYDKAIMTISEIIQASGCAGDCSLYGISCDMDSSAKDLSPVDEVPETEDEELSPEMAEASVLPAEEEKGGFYYNLYST